MIRTTEKARKSKLIVWVLLLFLAPTAALAQNLIQNGQADLRGRSFNEAVHLDGEWGFYWHQLIDPKAFDGSSPETIYFPKRWRELEYQGKTLPARGYASYTARILISPSMRQLGFDMPDMYTSYRMYINGKLLVENGNPDSISSRAVPRWERKIVNLPESLGDTLDVVIHVANFWHSKGGPFKPIRLGDAEMLSTDRRLDNAFDLVLFGCLLMGGLFFLGLFRFGNHDKVLLFFALFCITYSYRIIGTSNYVLHQILPGLSWHVAVVLEYFSLFASIGFFSLYTLRLYPNESNELIMRIAVGINMLLAVLVLITPPSIFTMTINPFLILMSFFIVYMFYVYFRAYKNKRLGSGYALLSTAVVLAVMTLINLQYFGIIMPDKFIIFLGYIAFFFLQSLILSYRFAEQLNSARREAETALKVKSEFLSTMSHEIRTPLNSVIGMTHILLRERPRTDQQEQLNVLLFAARNLLSIVNDILDYNKIEAGKITLESIPVDLTNLCRNIFLGLRAQGIEKNLEMKLELPEELQKKLLTDPTRLSQVLVNLLHNAIKFTKEGTVKLEVKLLSKEKRKVKLHFAIIDTGIGIAHEKKELIFERFTQADSSTSRSFGGTGLGLSIARRILELLGTRLELESVVNRGSTFHFILQLIESDEDITLENSQQALLADEEQGKPLHGVDILLVEDNALNVLVARAFLERWGAHVDVATNGQEAIDRLDSGRHKLVLMDLHMPVMDGYEATRKLRARGETLPIIALTASLPKEIEKDALRAGLDAIVVKPFDPEDLRHKLLQFVQAAIPANPNPGA